MQSKANEFLKGKFQESGVNEDPNATNSKIGFHIPMVTMINHMHLHILKLPLTTRGSIEFSWLLFNPIDRILTAVKPE